VSSPITAAPTLFVVSGGGEPTLDDIILGALAQPELSGCLVCGGQLDPVTGGAHCRDCGSDVLTGPEPVAVWAA
jgi:hypothetical protein